MGIPENAVSRGFPLDPDPKDPDGTPRVRWSAGTYKVKDLDQVAYNGAMEQGVFFGYEGPPPRPGTGWGPAWSEASDAAWLARYKDGFIGADGYYSYGPRYHGPAQWEAKYTRLVLVLTTQRYDLDTKGFVAVNATTSPSEAPTTKIPPGLQL